VVSAFTGPASEALPANGDVAGPLMALDETIMIMKTMDAIAAQARRNA
jgi:hypothetical protein